LTHLHLEKKSAQTLAVAAIYNLHLSDVNLAANNIRAIFVLVNGTHDERTDISQLVRIAIAQIGIAATWELCSRQIQRIKILPTCKQPFPGWNLFTLK
jgi:hypothetical protein